MFTGLLGRKNNTKQTTKPVKMKNKITNIWLIMYASICHSSLNSLSHSSSRVFLCSCWTKLNIFCMPSLSFGFGGLPFGFDTPFAYACRMVSCEKHLSTVCMLKDSHEDTLIYYILCEKYHWQVNYNNMTKTIFIFLDFYYGTNP